MKKKLNVYEAAQVRLDKIFSDFDNIYVSFSGGKDSGVLLNLCIDYIRQHRLKRKIGVFHMDYEVQYRETVSYVNKVLSSNSDILDIYRVCVPFKVPTCTSMFQNYWRPWDKNLKSIWVNEKPENSMGSEIFPFYNEDMWDYQFQFKFAEWLHEQKGAKRTCCLIGIRTQESFNRWRAIYIEKSQRTYSRLKWIHRLAPRIYNAYPIYDWKTKDIWIANGKCNWDYNHLYDLYYQAGVSLEKQRVASPFISQALASLRLYRAIDPDTWGKMIGRVNGVGFAGIYGGTSALGWQSVKLPQGMTWKSYMEFLLSTLPEKTREGYLQKISVSIKFWRERGGCLSDETIKKLIEAKIPIEVVETTKYKTTKKPVRMEYLDDIKISEFRELPTYKRVCICILKNDYHCKYMGFSLNTQEKKQRENILKLYKSKNYG